MASSTRPLRILVVDDDPAMVGAITALVGTEGHQVITAYDGLTAVKRFREEAPDIVLLDIVMPDLDGIEVMRQLREQRPVPVILLTAKGATADKAKGLDLGADDYIAKPFHPDELAARVRAVIRRSGGAEPGAGVIKFDDVEIDLDALQEAQKRKGGFGAVKTVRQPLPMCKAEVAACYEHRSDELGCVNPEFFELPRGKPSFRVVEQQPSEPA